MKLAVPDYVARDANGNILELYCKCCGAVIAQMRGRNFWRDRKYAEIKITFSDGNAHVTNLCITCVPLVRKNPDALWQIYQADLDDMAIEQPNIRDVLGPRGEPVVTVVDTKSRGIR